MSAMSPAANGPAAPNCLANNKPKKRLLVRTTRATPRHFCAKSGQRIEERGDRFRSLARERRREQGLKEKGTLSPGILYEYQKKRVGRRGFCKSMKEKNL